MVPAVLVQTVERPDRDAVKTAPNTTADGSLACAYGTPWLDHFSRPTGTGRGCQACGCTPMNETYRDGVGIERCNRCGYAIRGKDDAPLVSVPLDLAEQLLLQLQLRHFAPGSIGAGWVTQMEQICGRPVRQIREETR